MYAIYHQIDREKREQEEKENEQNLVEELKQLEQKYKQLLRRDSYSTITTHDTEMIIETKMDRKHLAPITWSQNGELPFEISVPETKRKMKDENLLGSHESSVNDNVPAYEPPKQQDNGLRILQNTLFVDDEDELDLIFDDNHEDEMNVQRTVGRPIPQDVLSSSSESSEESLYTTDQEDETNVHQRAFGTPTSRDVSLISSSDSSAGSLYTDDTSRDSEDLLRFETERFTRFEI